MQSIQWKFASSSVIGTSHIERATPCQDFHKLEIIDPGDGEIVIAVVADGAGSASEGLAGAEQACSSFIEHIRTHFQEGKNIADLDRTFCEDWIQHFQQKIADIAESHGKSKRDYACTLLASILEDETAVFYQIGDGAIIYSSTDHPDRYCLAICPSEAAYINVTDFVTDEAAAEKLIHSTLSQPVQNVAMLTDGLQSLAINYNDGYPGNPHIPFLLPMFSPFSESNWRDDLDSELEKFLTSDAVNERTDDDKTLILISRRSVASNSFPATQGFRCD